MTCVSVYFTAPEPQFAVELDVRSQAAWDRWKAAESHEEAHRLWDAFLRAFESQMDTWMGDGGSIDEVYEDYE